ASGTSNPVTSGGDGNPTPTECSNEGAGSLERGALSAGPSPVINRGPYPTAAVFGPISRPCDEVFDRRSCGLHERRDLRAQGGEPSHPGRPLALLRLIKRHGWA